MIHVIDTSALKWAYLAGKWRRRLRFIISLLKGEVYVAEISMLEFVSSLGDEYRGGRITLKQYEVADRLFINDLARGRIHILHFPAAEFIQCRHLLAYVGIQSSRNLRSHDAIIVHTARQLAIEKRAPVKFVTSDRRLANIVKDMRIFAGLVRPVYLKRP